MSLTLPERIGQVVGAAVQQGTDQSEVAATLMSFAARYALQIGWSPELVSGSQREALQLHCDALGLPRP